MPVVSGGIGGSVGSGIGAEHGTYVTGSAKNDKRKLPIAPIVLIIILTLFLFFAVSKIKFK